MSLYRTYEFVHVVQVYCRGLVQHLCDLAELGHHLCGDKAVRTDFSNGNIVGPRFINIYTIWCQVDSFNRVLFQNKR